MGHVTFAPGDSGLRRASGWEPRNKALQRTALRAAAERHDVGQTMSATGVAVPADKRRIGRSLLLAVVAPIAFLVISGGVAVAIGNSSFLVVLVLAWIPVVLAAMVGTHEILWGRRVGSHGQRITQGFGSFALRHQVTVLVHA